MTALDTPFNPGQNRGQAPQVGRQGIQLTPNAPGLVPLPPTSQEGSQLRQMIDAIGLAGQVGRTVGNIADNELRRREFKQRDFDRLYESAAAVEARVAITEIQTQIENGEIEVPEGTSVGDYAAQLASARLPEDAPDAYQNRYRSILVPEVASRIASKQAADIEKAKSENLKLLAEGVYSIASTPEEMVDAVEQAKRIDPDLTDLEARSVVLLPTLQVAIEQGDRTTFDIVAKALGMEFATTIARGRIQLENQSLRNEQQAKSQDMVEATRIIDAAIDSPLISDDTISKSIDGMQLDSTQRATLKSRLINRRQEQLAADRSNQRQLLETIQDAASSPDELRRALTRNADPLGLTPAEIDREVMVYARAQIELAASRGDLDRINELAPTLGTGSEASLLIDEARNVATNVTRDKRFKTLLNGMQAGKIDPIVVRQAVIEDAKRAIDNPDSPDVLSTAQREDLLRKTQIKEQRDLSIERVGKVMTGDGRVVITRQDDEAIDQMLGSAEEGGFGLIDAANNITDPVRLGASVASLNRVTANTRDVLMTNLMRGQPDQQVQAMQTLSVIAQGRPGLLSEFAGDDLNAGMVLAEIRTMTDRGIIGNQPGVARERIGALVNELNETTIDQRAIDSRLKDDGIAIEKEIETVLDSAVQLMPWRDPAGLFNKAELVDTSDEAMQYISDQYRQQYDYQRRLGRSKDDATKFARRTSQELFLRNFDVVRFNGELHAQRIDNGVNRLREDFRWSDGYHTLIETFAVKNGIELDEVFTVRPTTGVVTGNNGEPIEGWLLIDNNLDPITDDAGRVLLWEPPATMRDKSLQNRKLLEEKQAEYNNRPASKTDTTFEGLDLATIMSIP